MALDGQTFLLRSQTNLINEDTGQTRGEQNTEKWSQNIGFPQEVIWLFLRTLFLNEYLYLCNIYIFLPMSDILIMFIGTMQLFHCPFSLVKKCLHFAYIWYTRWVKWTAREASVAFQEWWSSASCYDLIKSLLKSNIFFNGSHDLHFVCLRKHNWEDTFCLLLLRMPYILHYYSQPTISLFTTQYNLFFLEITWW